MPKQSIQGHEIGGVATYSQKQVMLRHHVIGFPPAYRETYTGYNAARAESPLGALILCRLSDEILNPGQNKSSRLSLPKFMAALMGTTEIPGPFIFMAQRHLHPI